LTAHLDAMLALCETVECRRMNMLSYFGEASTPCGNCDTCLHPPTTWDGTVAAQKLLSTVVRLERERHQHFGAGQLIDILRGNETERVRRWNHEALSTWGIGSDLTEAQWRGVVRQLLARSELALSVDGHSTLGITDLGWEVLRGHREVPLREDVVRRAGAVREKSRTRSGPRTPELPTDLAEEDQNLFEALRTWRTSQARARAVPPYIIFPDSTLRAIAAHKPSSLEELSAISGVGTVKLATYGEAVLKVVRDTSA